MIYAISSSFFIILFSLIIGIILKNKQFISTLSIIITGLFCLVSVLIFPYLYGSTHAFFTLVILLGSVLLFSSVLPLIDTKFIAPYTDSVDRRKRRMDHLYTRGQHLYAYPLDDDYKPQQANTYS